MGHVYRAWDGRLHREVAIKVLNREFVMPGMRERFLREARAASALTHPNICTIFDIGEQDGDPYLVMELLQGINLKDRILDRSMPVEEIITIARDTAEALGAAHSKGIVHRDVKPANIFLIEKPNGGIQAKVLDFGLAKVDGGVLGSRTRNNDITTAGATVGTLAYMSPEQARGEPLDARSDLFSLGVVLYEMATRHVPFQGATSALVFVQLLHHDPESVRDWNEQVPRELEKVIFKLLSKNPASRYQSAHDLESALIAINERSGGLGWLRRAAASVPLVPLVRAADPVAREKRSTRQKHPSDPSNRSLELSPDRDTPQPITDPAPRQMVMEDHLLRPAQRVPRTDGTSLTPPPSNRPAATFTPVPSTTLPPGYLPPSARSHQLRGPQQALGARKETATQQGAVAALTPVPDSRSSSQDEPARKPSLPTTTTASGPRSKREAISRVQTEAAPPANQAAEPAEELVTTLRRAFKSLPNKRRRLSPFWILVSVCVGLIVALAIFLLTEPLPAPAAVLHRGDVITLAEIENHTGNTTLDDSVAEALAAQLAESSYFNLLAGPSYQSARTFVASTGPTPSQAGSDNQLKFARLTAERMGASAFLSGYVSSTNETYFLHVDLRSVASNRIITSLDERADSLNQLPSAIESLALDLRSTVGEPHAQVDLANFPLSQQFSANLAAIQSYAESDLLIAQQNQTQAIPILEKAVGLDPKFVAPRLRLAIIERNLGAETSAADSAKMALAASDGASAPVRKLAEATFEVESNGNLNRAVEILKPLLKTNPQDASILISLAHALNLQGRMTDALPYAQKVYSEDPFNADAYSEAEFALVGLDRFDAAFQLDAQAQRLGVARSRDTLTAAYLSGHLQDVEALLNKLRDIPESFTPDETFANALDNEGRLSAGRALWISRAKSAVSTPTLRSAASLLYADAALNRALIGECSESLTVLREADQDPSLPRGPLALSHEGLARALCGDIARATQIAADLQQRYPRNLQVNASALPQIQAAIALSQNSPANTIKNLQGSQNLDLGSISPFLLARANLDLHQPSLAIVSLQAALAHRGSAFLFGGDVNPIAQLELARAFASSGDLGNSAEAYRRFLALWGSGDPDLPLLNEARIHAQN
jgi:serine/threonine protein kinase/predicted Zn-dependent protease